MQFTCDDPKQYCDIYVEPSASGRYPAQIESANLTKYKQRSRQIYATSKSLNINQKFEQMQSETTDSNKKYPPKALAILRQNNKNIHVIAEEKLMKIIRPMVNAGYRDCNNTKYAFTLKFVDSNEHYNIEYVFILFLFIIHILVLSYYNRKAEKFYFGADHGVLFRGNEYKHPQMNKDKSRKSIKVCDGCRRTYCEDEQNRV